MNYNVTIGTLSSGAWSLLILGGLVFVIIDSETDFMCLGPSDVEFAGFKVNTWPRWVIVMNYSVFSQVIYTITRSTSGPYISNVIRDHKTPIEDKGTKMHAQITVFVYTLFFWLSSMMDVFLWITLQMQYIVPALVTDLLITIYFTNIYMKPKKEKNKDKEKDKEKNLLENEIFDNAV